MPVKAYLSRKLHHSGFIIPGSLLILVLSSCSVNRQLSRAAQADILDNKALQTAHVGISIYEPAAGKYWFNHQGDKYFVPASNTKIPTCYAAMKYLGERLTSFRMKENEDTLWVQPCGDPSFLHPEFPFQPVWETLRQTAKKIMIVYNSRNRVEPYGSGWSWNDYEASYMAERAVMPVYGNVFRFELRDTLLKVSPPVLKKPYFSEPLMQLLGLGKKFRVSRANEDNHFQFIRAASDFSSQQVPFKTKRGTVNLELLRDTLPVGKERTGFSMNSDFSGYQVINSQHTDSLLRPLMHRSDNFYAEQSLLMVSQALLGYMSDERIMDTLLKTDFKDLPQQPRWSDGSGLSRYNLFTPQDFVMILDKMRTEFGMDRVKLIFPTGGEGTLSSFYKTESGFIYAKTGTLSGVVALSGFLYTKKGKLLIFSTLVNNHQASATEVRKAVEKFIRSVRDRY